MELHVHLEGTLELLERRPWERVLGIDLAGTERENDPARFQATLSRELGTLDRCMGFSRADVLSLIRNSFRSGFAPGQLFS